MEVQDRHVSPSIPSETIRTGNDSEPENNAESPCGELYKTYFGTGSGLRSVLTITLFRVGYTVFDKTGLNHLSEILTTSLEYIMILRTFTRGRNPQWKEFRTDYEIDASAARTRDFIERVFGHISTYYGTQNGKSK